MKAIKYLLQVFFILTLVLFIKAQWDNRITSSEDLLKGQYYDYATSSEYSFFYGEKPLRTANVHELPPEEYYSFGESAIQTVYLRWDENQKKCTILNEKQGDCTKYCLLESPEYGILLVPPYEDALFFQYKRPLAFYLAE